jgi:hypothetical protein
MLDTIVTIIDRYATDSEFRHAMQVHPETALAGYQLSGEEHVAVSAALNSEGPTTRPTYSWQ